MNTLHTSFTIMLSVALLGQAADAQDPATTTLDVAVEQGLVSVEATSLGCAVGNTVRHAPTSRAECASEPPVTGTWMSLARSRTLLLSLTDEWALATSTAPNRVDLTSSVKLNRSI